MAKNLLTVEHTIGSSTREVALRDSTFTAGRSYKNNIISPASDYLPDEHPFLKAERGRGILRLIDGMTGEYTKNGVTISIQDLIHAAVLRSTGGKHHILTLSEGSVAKIVIGENTVTISFKPPPPKVKKIRHKKDRSLLRPVFDAKEGMVSLFIIISLIIHGAGVQYINSIKPPEKKKGEVTRAPERFARFILSPPEKKEPPLTKKIRKIKERKIKKQKKKLKRKKITEKKEIKKTEKSDSKPKKKRLKKRLKKPVLTERRQKIRKKLASRALLGVITSREIVEKSEEIFAEMESFLGDITEGSDTASLSGQITSFETISEGFDDFSEDEEKIEEYQKKVKHDKDEKRVRLVKKETLKLKKEEEDREIDDRAHPRKKSVIDKVVRTYIGGLKFLYNKELRKDNSLRGKIVVKFTISPEGKVTAIELIKTTFTNKLLVKKMLKRIKKWRFPKEDVDETTVIYPFVFMPVG